jgi:hypothetical protein
MTRENPEVDQEQGKRDTERRPVLTDKDEQKRQDEEKEGGGPVDPE